MKLNVVFTTYNATEWLKKVLWGFSFQTHKDFDIIIADDGSTDATKKLIEEMRESTGLTIRHIWHEDNGFQKCRILNKALLNVTSDYIVLTDGDCIPRKDFLEVHAQNAARGKYLSGSYYKLPMSTSEIINYEDVKAGRCFDVKWLRDNGLPKSRKTLKINTSRKWARLFNRISPTKCNLKGSNASVWLDDVLAINGFDERMQWGGLDREFGVRLVNHGIKPTHVRYDAVCVHLDHARGYKDPEMVKQNKQLRLDNAKFGVKWTEHGIQQLLDEGYQPETNYALERLKEIKTHRPNE